MQQGGSGGGEMKHNQDRSLKPTQGDQNQPQLPPQKCPRCDSFNTKFCYYNNYSLSQPRYFCKTCRRYWTRGGTLRNVPVGGGCRKGKRTKGSSSSSSSASSGQHSGSQSSDPQQQQNLLSPHSFICSSGSGNTAKVSPPGISAMGSYNHPPASGFLTSIPAIQSLNNQLPPPPPPPFTHQPLSTGGGDLGGGSSNLSLLHGFNVVSPFGSQQNLQIQQQRQFYHLGRDEESLIHSGRQASTTSQLQNWHQGFVTTINPSVSDTALWSISTSTTGHTGNSNSTTAGGSSSLNPDHHQWHDLPGYGPPP